MNLHNLYPMIGSHHITGKFNLKIKNESQKLQNIQQTTFNNLYLIYNKIMF